VGEEELAPCPFCGAGETRVDENVHWTGMRSVIVNVEVKHWCAGEGRSFIALTGLNRELAVMRWNTRVEADANAE
jgi:hypothetical protein